MRMQATIFFVAVCILSSLLLTHSVAAKCVQDSDCTAVGSQFCSPQGNCVDCLSDNDCSVQGMGDVCCPYSSKYPLQSYVCETTPSCAAFGQTPNTYCGGGSVNYCCSTPGAQVINGVCDCPSGTTYSGGSCVGAPFVGCGDGTCNNGETGLSCPADCPTTHSSPSVQSVQIPGTGKYELRFTTTTQVPAQCSLSSFKDQSTGQELASSQYTITQTISGRLTHIIRIMTGPGTYEVQLNCVETCGDAVCKNSASCISYTTNGLNQQYCGEESAGSYSTSGSSCPLDCNCGGSNMWGYDNTNDYPYCGNACGSASNYGCTAADFSNDAHVNPRSGVCGVVGNSGRTGYCKQCDPGTYLDMNYGKCLSFMFGDGYCMVDLGEGPPSPDCVCPAAPYGTGGAMGECSPGTTRLNCIVTHTSFPYNTDTHQDSCSSQGCWYLDPCPSACPPAALQCSLP